MISWNQKIIKSSLKLFSDSILAQKPKSKFSYLDSHIHENKNLIVLRSIHRRIFSIKALSLPHGVILQARPYSQDLPI